MITINRIRFDRMMKGGAGAVPLRPSSTQPAAPFDWVNAGLERQPVAYARSAGGRSLTLTVELTVLAQAPAEILVRAGALPGAPLGDVRRFSVPGATIGSVSRTTEIAEALGAHPVGRNVVRWHWEVSSDGGASWTPIRQTEHDIYVVLDEPQFPWGLPGDDKRVAPWADAVELACEWARGTDTTGTASRAITEGIHALGGKRIRDLSGVLQSIGWQGGTNYHGSGTFKCSEFINLARLRPTNKYQINCRDCASAVGTFATVLGVPMERTHLLAGTAAEFLVTKRVWLLGGPAGTVGEFYEHIIASAGSGHALVVWDACLKVDFDPGPRYDWDVAAAVPFEHGSPNEPAYLELLLQHGQPLPEVSAGESLRYPDAVPPRAAAFYSPADERHRARLERIIDEGGAITGAPDIRDLALLGVLGIDKSAIVSEEFAAGGMTYLQRHATLKAAGASDARLQIDLIATQSAAQTREVLLELLLGYSSPLVPVPNIGHMAFYSPADESIVMVRNTVVVWLRNDVQRAVPIELQIRDVDARLAPALPK